MKKLLLFSVLIAGMTFGQTFKLTPENYKTADNKDYVVYEFPGKSKTELFKTAKIYITSNYKNLKGDGYNEVEPDQIVLNLRANAGTIKRLGIPVIGGDFTNRYEINFKDEKIMVKPQFESIELPDGMGGLTDKQAFNKKGDVSINKIHFEGIQEKTNQFVEELQKGMQKSSDW